MKKRLLWKDGNRTMPRWMVNWIKLLPAQHFGKKMLRKLDK